MVTTIMTERWRVPELNRRTRLDGGVRERQRDVAGLSRGFAGAVPLSWITPLMAMPPGTVFGLMLIATGGSMGSASERVAPPAEPFIPTFVTAVRSRVLTWNEAPAPAVITTGDVATWRSSASIASSMIFRAAGGGAKTRRPFNTNLRGQSGCALLEEEVARAKASSTESRPGGFSTTDGAVKTPADQTRATSLEQAPIPTPRADFFERDAGCREHRVTIGTDWAEMRIAENAWFRFATEAKRKEFRFRVHGRAHAD